MRILYVDLGRGWRGGQQQALLLARGLRARGLSAEFIAPRGSLLACRALAEAIPVHPVGPHAVRLQTAWLLRRLLPEQRFDVLHANEAHALTAIWLAGAHRRVPLVASRRVAYLLERNPVAVARYRAARRILAVSRFVAESVTASGLPMASVEVIYDGVEVPPVASPDVRRQARQGWGANEDQILLGCVGYLLPEKGHQFLIRALAKLRAQFGTSRLLLAGDGPCRNQLERLVEELDLGSAVHFAGFVKNVSEFYAALDIFVFPSLAEPLGSSLLTAMANGLPVVAVARGAVPEVVEDGRTGLLVRDPDAASLAAAVARYLRDPVFAADVGLAARETIKQRFTADQMVENTLRVYREVCATGGSE